MPVQMLFVANCLFLITYASYETTVSFFRRLDGRTWEPILSLPAGVLPQALATSPEGILYLATSLGVYRSLDHGTTWIPSARAGDTQIARPSDSLVDVTVVPGSPDSVLTSGYSGIWRSEDAGTTWQPSSDGIDGNEFDALAVAADSSVYTAVQYQGVFRSRDRGTTWRKRSHGLHLGPPTAVDFRISALATDPHDPARVYAAILVGGSLTALLAQTTDTGDTWHYLSLPADASFVWRLQVDPSASKSLYAIVDGPGLNMEILHSSDSGESWRPLLVDVTIFSLAIDPMRPTTLYAGTTHRVQEGYQDRFLKSVDGGRTWRLAGRGLPQTYVSALVVDPQDPHRLYAGTGADGVYVSSDKGESFRPMNRGLPGVTFAEQLIIDPRHPSFLYLLELDHGVFRWLPEAATWTPIKDGLHLQFQDRSTYLLAIDPVRPDVLYAGGGRGLFQLTVR